MQDGKTGASYCPFPSLVDLVSIRFWPSGLCLVDNNDTMGDQ